MSTKSKEKHVGSSQSIKNEVRKTGIVGGRQIKTNKKAGNKQN